METMLTASQLEDWEAYKFVRVDGQYRFADLTSGVQHCDLVQKGEHADSAGAIGVNPDSWVLLHDFSTSLKVGCKGDEVPQLTALLQRPFKERK